MADITYIPIRQLYPHPDNPRKELGDLSELAASIKENGVYQNLTVIPGHYLNSREYIAKCVDEGGDAAAAAAAWTPKAVWSSDDYTIIIGHRRAAAAQQAGLYELPCAIVEMDEREQMTDLVKCDRCGTPFSIQTAGIRATWSGDYMVQYFTCPGCHHRYQILTTDTELRQTIQRHKAIAAKIKLGQTKHFRPGTLKKYQAEMEKLEAEQKKRRDELLDKGNEILAQLGEE